MDLLPQHSDSDNDTNNPINSENGAERKPEAKPSIPAAPKAFDIFSPNKTAPPASSRPIIVSHKAMAKDTTVTGNQEVLKQENREATAPPPQEERRQMLDTHKKVNLQPVNGEAESDKKEEEHTEHADERLQHPPDSIEKSENPPEYDHPLEANKPDNSEHSHVEPKFETFDAKPVDKAPATEPEPKHDEPKAPSAAFSAPEHTDQSPVAPETHDKDELLIPAHTGGGYNEPVQDSEEQFNQFVVSHHKTARQKWLKKFGIIFAVVLAAAAILGVVIWKTSS
ncbi:MAG TPA: hypothetical protein VLG47_04360 [Candidatus Saccharimonadales bacterium]|nr:hypothetical protein [Candidatus Saccharimonadales bacterium]